MKRVNHRQRDEIFMGYFSSNLISTTPALRCLFEITSKDKDFLFAREYNLFFQDFKLLYMLRKSILVNSEMNSFLGVPIST